MMKMPPKQQKVGRVSMVFQQKIPQCLCQRPKSQGMVSGPVHLNLMYRIPINMLRLTLAWPKRDRPPIVTTLHVLNQVAMSLSLRLNGIQSKAEPSPNDLAHLTLQELEIETVDFGKKNCGRS